MRLDGASGLTAARAAGVEEGVAATWAFIAAASAARDRMFDALRVDLEAKTAEVKAAAGTIVCMAGSAATSAADALAFRRQAAARESDLHAQLEQEVVRASSLGLLLATAVARASSLGEQLEASEAHTSLRGAQLEAAEAHVSSLGAQLDAAEKAAATREREDASDARSLGAIVESNAVTLALRDAKLQAETQPLRDEILQLRAEILQQGAEILQLRSETQQLRAVQATAAAAVAGAASAAAGATAASATLAAARQRSLSGVDDLTLTGSAASVASGAIPSSAVQWEPASSVRRLSLPAPVGRGVVAPSLADTPRGDRGRGAACSSELVASVCTTPLPPASLAARLSYMQAVARESELSDAASVATSGAVAAPAPAAGADSSLTTLADLSGNENAAPPMEPAGPPACGEGGRIADGAEAVAPPQLQQPVSAAVQLLLGTVPVPASAPHPDALPVRE